MDYRILNEAGKGAGSFDKILSIAAGATDAAISNAAKNAANPDNYSYSSIAKAASKLVAVFPVLASRTVSAETAQMVSKYIEQKACNLFTLALQQANISNAKSGVEYLRQFHQNLDVGGDNINAIINTMQSWIDAYDAGRVFTENSLSASMINQKENDTNYSDLFEADMDLEISSRDMAVLMQIMKEQSEVQFYDTQLNPVSVNDFVVNEFADGTYHVSIKPYEYFTEAKGGRNNGNNNRAKPNYRKPGLNSTYRREVAAGRMTEEEAYQRQADDKEDDTYPTDLRPAKGIRDKQDYDAKINRETEHKEDRERQQKEHGQDRAYELARRKQEREDRQRRLRDREEQKQDRDEQRREHREDRAYTLAQRAKEAQKEKDERAARKASGNNVSLKDMDIKKMNDAVPSLLVVRFYQSETASVVTEFIIGVKSKLIPVTTTEILRRIMNDNKDSKKFLNLMRTITGELKLQDVVLGLSRIKDDLNSTRNKGAYGEVWNLLANRAKAANEAIKHGKHNDFSAITTVLISQSDADDLYREENFDITDPKNAMHFMQSYNLMGFAIADDATETIKILMDDGEKYFSEYAYHMFERESKDGTYKKLINLMAASK